MIVTPANGVSVVPGRSKPAGLNANDWYSPSWSVRCGFAPAAGTNPDWPGGSTVSAWITRAWAPAGMVSRAASAASAKLLLMGGSYPPYSSRA